MDIFVPDENFDAIEGTQGTGLGLLQTVPAPNNTENKLSIRIRNLITF